MSATKSKETQNDTGNDSTGESDVPSVSYEGVILAQAAKVSAGIDLERLAPEFRTQAHAERLHAGHVEIQRDRFREYEVMGNHYANVLENPDTPAELHNAIGDEMMELADAAGLSITSPENCGFSTRCFATARTRA